MKIKTSQYARALLDLSTGKTESEISLLVSRFLGLLQKNLDLDLVPKIISDLDSLALEDAGSLELEILSARPIEAELKEKIAKDLEQRLALDKKIQFKEVIDKDFIGGYRVEYDSHRIDGSIKNNLLNFKNQLKK